MADHQAPSSSGRSNIFECHHCRMAFIDPNDLVSHINSHHQQGSLTCDECDEKFLNEESLVQHRLSHQDQRPYKCNNCQETFSFLSDIKEHMKNHNESDEKNRPVARFEGAPLASSDSFCKYCGKVYKDATVLAKHIWVHFTSNAYACALCDKVFVRPADLKRHVTVHTGENKFQCPHCPNSYSQRSSLNTHLVNNHNIRPFECHTCHERFLKIYELHQHRALGQCGTGEPQQEMSFQPYQAQPMNNVQIQEQNNMPTFSVVAHGQQIQQPQQAMGNVVYVNQYNQPLVPQTITLNPWNQQPVTVSNMNVIPHSQTSTVGHMINMPSNQVQMAGMQTTMQTTMAGNNVVIPDLQTPIIEDVSPDSANTSSSTAGKPSQGSVPADRQNPQSSDQISDVGKFAAYTNTPFACLQCGESFAKEDELKTHVALHEAKKGGLQCLKCSKTFVRLSLLQRHELAHSSEQKEVCTICSKRYKQKAALTVHLWKAHGIGKPKKAPTHPCPVCDKMCDTPYRLERHMLVHSQERPMQCDICNSKYKQKSALLEHLRFVHGVGKIEIHSCKQCEKTFISEWRLRKHERTHDSTKPYECTECNAKFKIKDFLVAHMKNSHGVGGENLHMCSMCDKGFPSQSRLERHERTHSEEQPEECYICGNKYKHKASLYDHLRNSHSEGQTPTFACTKCDKVFMSKSRLKTHELCHSKDQTEKCCICGGVYKHAMSLYDHLRNLHKVKGPSADVIAKNRSMIAKDKVATPEDLGGLIQKKCDHCEMGFYDEDALKEHIFTHISANFTLYSYTEGGQFKVGYALKEQGEPGLDPKALIGKGGKKKGRVRRKRPERDESNKEPVADLNKDDQTCVFGKSASKRKKKKRIAGGGGPGIESGGNDQAFSNGQSNMEYEPLNDETAIDEHELEDVFKCQKCLKVFNQPVFLERHIRQQHGRPTGHQCPDCGKKFLSKAGLKRHAKTIHKEGNKAGPCPVCNATFQNSIQLSEHLSTHENDQSHACQHCGKSFSRAATLRTHLKKKHGMPSLGSDDLYFDEEKGLFTKMLPGHTDDQAEDEEPGTEECSNAEKHDNIKEFSTHKQSIGDLMCTYCGMQFEDETLLSEHFQTHIKNSVSPTNDETKEKNADGSRREIQVPPQLRRRCCKCYICFKMFRRPSDLSRHMMIHTGERPCQCQFCPAGFILLYALKKHTIKYHRKPELQKLAHTTLDNAPIQKAKIGYRNRLNHKFINLKQKEAFVCCDLQFKTLKEIQLHWLIHREDAKHVCPHCGMRFTKGFTRTKHIMRVHSGSRHQFKDHGKKFRSLEDVIMGTQEEHVSEEELTQVFTDSADSQNDSGIVENALSPPNHSSAS